MKKLILLLILVLFVEAEDRAVKISTKLKQEQRVAFIVGNNDYKGVLSKLRNPINDARLMRSVLESKGFEVIYRENINKRDIKDTLKKFYEKIQKGGVGLFYFSGHGVELDGKNYLIPIDAKLDEKSDTEFEAIALNQITRKMQNAKNRLNIVILDACRNDPFSRSAGVGGLAKIEPIGLFVSYSTGAGSVASDGKAGENGLFTKYLVKNMSRSLDLQNVFQKTREEVYIASNKKQFPAIYNQTINGKFYFTPPSSNSKVENIRKVVEYKQVNYVPEKDFFIKTIIDPKLKDKVSISNSSSRIKNGMFQVILDIKNHQNKKSTINYRYKWFDDDGFEVGENMSIWQPLFIEADDNKKIKELAPVPNATNCKVYLK